ncbi:MAG: hypothetical protein BWY99_01698 [Synergistetes bacterium ADurb.BinA166]|nr:MAG: hypothetical protein BWY99_01698 [Synergistetes bacterium ADurb.BinA166]
MYRRASSLSGRSGSARLSTAAAPYPGRAPRFLTETFSAAISPDLSFPPSGRDSPWEDMLILARSGMYPSVDRTACSAASRDSATAQARAAFMRVTRRKSLFTT